MHIDKVIKIEGNVATTESGKVFEFDGNRPVAIETMCRCACCGEPWDRNTSNHGRCGMLELVTGSRMVLER